LKDLSEGLIWYVVFLLLIAFHEFAHEFTAMKMGDLTVYESGHVSLNSIPHMNREQCGTMIIPIGSFVLGGLMIGWASTPYDREWAYTHPKKSAAMSAAGPISNFILLLLSALLIHAGILLDFFRAYEIVWISSIVESADSGVFVLLAKIPSIMFSLNLILFIFNMIPYRRLTIVESYLCT
jgi:Zn-dependent protease